MTDRELDAKVAEKVMGCKWFTNREGDISELLDHATGVFAMSQGWADGKRGEAYYPGPRYSTDIARAWEVIDALRKTRQFCCIEIKSDYDYCWDIRITKESLDPHGTHDPFVKVCTQNLPRGICVAALRAVGCEVEG